MLSLKKTFFGDANKKVLRDIEPLVRQINNLEEGTKGLSSEDMKKKTLELKERLHDGESLDTLLPQAFALVREASVRTLGMRHFDVQLMGGVVLHRGNIAEMRTGEGKTLVATLPAYLNALPGRGVHVITVNDYLARRDAVWMGQVYAFLGLSVGNINHDQSLVSDPDHTEKDEVRDEVGSYKVVEDFLRPCTRREAYEADITYGTNNEYGFDYLRDNIGYEEGNLRQRDYHYAIVY